MLQMVPPSPRGEDRGEGNFSSSTKWLGRGIRLLVFGGAFNIRPIHIAHPHFPLAPPFFGAKFRALDATTQKPSNERLLLLLLAAIQFTINIDFLIILPLGPQY